MMHTKDFLPKSLYGRALLILVVPTVLIQMVLAYVFFDRHWDTVKGYLANNLAGEIAFFMRQLATEPPATRAALAMEFADDTGVAVSFEPKDAYHEEYATPLFPEFQWRLRVKLDEKPFTVRRVESGSVIEIRILQGGQTVKLETTTKRLESRTTSIFFLWMVGASALFLFIAIIFLRNQIRPIKQLARAADSFGRGVDTLDFRPHGAREIRTASRAFLVMRERIRRQLRTRTEMLAGISHDLRTPLTRMKLQLAMLGDSEAIRELSDDVQQMEHMIQEYLDFARGAGREEAVRTNLTELLRSVQSDYQRLAANVNLFTDTEVEMELRVSGFRRMMHNLIDNALRYGKRCEVTLRVLPNYCELTVDDAGPGIPAEKREEVFRPFSRLDPSRNIKTGGVGLGLTIARDIVLAHGGTIDLDSAPIGGLRVTIRLPL